MTAADHANTVREILDAEGTFIYRRDEFLDALDALQAQAETADDQAHWRQLMRTELASVEADRDRLAAELERRERRENLIWRMAVYGPGEGTTPAQALDTIAHYLAHPDSDFIRTALADDGGTEETGA